MGNKNWETPIDIFKELDDEFHFTIDVAASHENALRTLHCTIDGTYTFSNSPESTHDHPVKVDDRNGLEFPWDEHRVWCNPPYDSTLPQWLAKHNEPQLVVYLLPPTRDSKWYRKYIWGSTQKVMLQREKGLWMCSRTLAGEFEVREYAGRIRFNLNGKPGLAPRQGNTLAIWRNK